MTEAQETVQENTLVPSAPVAGAERIQSAATGAIAAGNSSDPVVADNVTADDLVREQTRLDEAAAANPLNAPVAPAVEEAVELKDATDDDIRGVADDTVDRTASGQPKVDALNERLEAAGFKPINADKRNELFPA